MKPKRGGGYVRVKPRTQTAITYVIGRLQYETGGRIVADDVVWEALQAKWPKEADRALKEVQIHDEADDDV